MLCATRLTEYDGTGLLDGFEQANKPACMREMGTSRLDLLNVAVDCSTCHDVTSASLATGGSSHPNMRSVLKLVDACKTDAASEQR